MIKKGKEIKLGKSYMNYNVSSGTVDSKNPTSVFLNISAWGEPTDEDIEQYTSVISFLKKEIKSHLFKTLPLSFSRVRTIVDLDIRESGVSYGKRSYMGCEITLYQSRGNNDLLMSGDLKRVLGQISDGLISDVFEKYPHFKFHKKKV